MALNPDALNLNYDSDDSMEVDSDDDNLPPSLHPPDPDPDPDADAEGDAEYVDDTSAILDNPVPGPSTPHKEYVSRPSSPFSVLTLALSQGCGRLGMSSLQSCVLIALDPTTFRATKTMLKTRMTTTTMLPMQMTSMARKGLLGRRRRLPRPRPLLGRKVRISSCICAVPIDDRPKLPHATLHQIQTQITVHDQRKRRSPACPGTRYVSPVGETRFRIITRIIKTLRCSRRRKLLRHTMSTPRSPKKTMRSRPF